MAEAAAAISVSMQGREKLGFLERLSASVAWHLLVAANFNVH
jgi:hypothetical protein